jgi:hypothetical protein
MTSHDRTALLALVDHGINMTDERLTQTPEFELLGSIRRQLEYIRSQWERGIVPSDVDKKRIIIGILAVREFETDDPEYAGVLETISYRYKHDTQ